MIELGFIWICFCIGLCDTLGDNLGVALFVTRVFAVRALHAGSTFEELSAQCAAHDIVELLLNELVSVLFNNIFLALTDSTLAAKTDVKRSSVLGLLDCRFKLICCRSSFWDGDDNLPKLMVSWIRPTGSNENHESM